MIPLDVSKPYRHTDEQSRMVFLFRYLTIDDEEEYNRIADTAQEAKGTSDESAAYRKYMKSLINFFLVGWEGTDVKFPENNPASAFKAGDLYLLASTIHKIIPQLLGGDFDDLKK
jgi:hypothetical protein